MVSTRIFMGRRQAGRAETVKLTSVLSLILPARRIHASARGDQNTVPQLGETPPATPETFPIKVDG